MPIGKILLTLVWRAIFIAPFGVASRTGRDALQPWDDPNQSLTMLKLVHTLTHAQASLT